jgi:Arc/MetJ family transcription regulator
MSSPRSVRFDDDVIRRLDRYVRSHPGTSASSVTNIFVDEALRAEEHPGIMFRPGPTGRRAGLVGGPDVWEVIGALQAVRMQDPGLADEALVNAVAEATGLNPRIVRVAVRYYTAYPAEVEERITANREAAEQAEAAWRAEQSLLRARDRAS